MKKAAQIFMLVAIFLCGISPSSPGQTWTQTSAPILDWWSIACSADGTKLTAINAAYYDSNPPASSVYTSTNSGATWTPHQPALTNYDEYWAWVAASADGTKLIEASINGQVHISTNSGTTWNRAPLQDFYWGGVAASADGNKLVALVYFGGPLSAFPGNPLIYTTKNGGSTWSSNVTATTTGQGWSWVASSADGNKLAVTTLGDTIYTSTNSGISWAATSAPKANWECIASSADGVNLIACEVTYQVGNSNYLPGSVYVSPDAGATWVIQNIPSNVWYSVAASADGSRLAAAAGNGPIYTSTDSGLNWSMANVPSNNWSSIVFSADGCRLYAVAIGGGIWTAQVSPSPKLNISLTNNFLLSWLIPSTNFTLQQSSDLTSNNWLNITNAPALNLTNLQNQVTLPPPAGNNYYRLKTQ